MAAVSRGPVQEVEDQAAAGVRRPAAFVYRRQPQGPHLHVEGAWRHYRGIFLFHVFHTFLFITLFCPPCILHKYRKDRIYIHHTYTHNTYEYEHLGTNRACTSQSINHIPRNSWYKPATHFLSAKESKLRIFLIKKLRIF